MLTASHIGGGEGVQDLSSGYPMEVRHNLKLNFFISSTAYAL